jgi:DNA mismatch endonuclease (patch repair protein)
MADNLTPEQRRRTMQAVKGKNTSLELRIDAELRLLNLAYDRHVADLPGKPDFVFRRERLVIFVDGDFWHGWRYPSWSHKLGDYWRKKIERNRTRDRANARRLRRQGWHVLRIWEHEVRRNTDAAVQRIHTALSNRHQAARDG